jgi:hypothetical protein
MSMSGTFIVSAHNGEEYDIIVLLWKERTRHFDIFMVAKRR